MLKQLKRIILERYGTDVQEKYVVDVIMGELDMLIREYQNSLFVIWGEKDTKLQSRECDYCGNLWSTFNFVSGDRLCVRCWKAENSFDRINDLNFEELLKELRTFSIYNSTPHPEEFVRLPILPADIKKLLDDRKVTSKRMIASLSKLALRLEVDMEEKYIVERISFPRKSLYCNYLRKLIKGFRAYQT